MVPTSDGGFIVFWQNPTVGAIARRFDAFGLPQSAEFSIDVSLRGKVAGNGQGDFVMVSTMNGQSSGIYAQRFDELGNSRGGPLFVPTGGTANAADPDVAVAPDGGFVVTWRDGDVVTQGRDGDLAGVFARRYSALGVPLGNDFQVNATTISSQLGARVAARPDGGFTIVWRSLNQDGDEFGIFAQRYNKDGRVRDAEFQVTEYGYGNQAFLDIAIDAQGVETIAWNDLDDGDVFVAQFDEFGVRMGESKINEVTDGSTINPSVGVDSQGDAVVVWVGPGVRSRMFPGQQYRINMEPLRDFQGIDQLVLHADDGRGRVTQSRIDVAVGSGAIGGEVFDDINGDGTRDPGELGVEGAVLFIDSKRQWNSGAERTVDGHRC